MPTARVGTFESPAINSKKRYRVQVSGEITDAPTSGDQVKQGGQVLEGIVYPPGGADSFGFTGEIVAFQSDAALTLQGAQVSTGGTNTRTGNRDGDSSTPNNQRNRSQGGTDRSPKVTTPEPAPGSPVKPEPAAPKRDATTAPGSQNAGGGGGILAGVPMPALAAGGLGLLALLYTATQ
jgi:hypothetical protein